MELSLNDLIVLALINEEPTHGYVLLEKLKTRNYEVWTGISVPTVYRLIKSLENRKLISSKYEQDGQGAPRRVYSLTVKGKNELQQGLLANMRNPVRESNSFDISLSAINTLDKTESLEAIEEYISNLEVGKKQMYEAKRTQGTLPWWADALFKHGEMRYDMELEFLNWLKDMLKKR